MPSCGRIRRRPTPVTFPFPLPPAFCCPPHPLCPAEERKPVGIANMLLSVANFNEALRVPQMLGLDYQAANLLSDVLAAPALAWVPSDLRRSLLEATMSVGKVAASPIRQAPGGVGGCRAGRWG